MAISNGVELEQFSRRPKIDPKSWARTPVPRPSLTLGAVRRLMGPTNGTTESPVFLVLIGIILRFPSRWAVFEKKYTRDANFSAFRGAFDEAIPRNIALAWQFVRLLTPRSCSTDESVM